MNRDYILALSNLDYKLAAFDILPSRRLAGNLWAGCLQGQDKVEG